MGFGDRDKGIGRVQFGDTEEGSRGGASAGKVQRRRKYGAVRAARREESRRSELDLGVQ